MPSQEVSVVTWREIQTELPVLVFTCPFCDRATEHEDEPCSECSPWYTRCSQCGNYCKNREITEDDMGTRLCPDCVQLYRICYYCERLVHRDDARYNSFSNLCCEDCYEEENTGTLHDYHYYPDGYPNFLPDDYRGKLYLGVELETDDFPDEPSSVAEQFINLSSNEELFWTTADDSLNRGIEFISSPATLEYHQTEFPWAKLLQAISDAGGKSHNTDTCGLHIHMSKAFLVDNSPITSLNIREDQIDTHTLKLLYILEHFWAKWVNFARRDNCSAAEKYSERHNSFKNMSLNRMKDLKWTEGRYRSLNITNRTTLEFRLFRGTLNLETLLATIEVVDFLARFVKSHTTEQIYNLTWYRLISCINKKKYPHLIAYLERRNLKRVPNHSQTIGDSPARLEDDSDVLQG